MIGDDFTAQANLTYSWAPNAALAALGVVGISQKGLNQYAFTFADLEVTEPNAEVTLVITDEQGASSAPVTFAFAVNAVNAKPQVAIAGPTTVNKGDTVSLVATATDPEGLRTLSYAWQQVDASGTPIAANDPIYVACSQGNVDSSCSFEAPLFNADQSLSFKLTVTEQGTEAYLTATTITKTLTVALGYVPWSLMLSSSTSVAEGASLSVSADLIAEGTAALTQYDWSASTCLGNPLGADVVTTGAALNVLTFNTPAGQKADFICRIALSVTDATGNTTVVTPLDVTVTAANDLPVAVIAARPLTLSGSSAQTPVIETLDGSASYDEESDALTYLWQQNPTDAVQVSWQTQGQTDGVATFTVPAQATAQTLHFTLTVCDAPNDVTRCDATPEAISLTLTASNQAPVAVISINGTAITDGTFTAQETNDASSGEAPVVLALSAAESSDPAPTDGRLSFAWSLALDAAEPALDLGAYASVTAWAEAELGVDPAAWASAALSFTTPNLAQTRHFIFTLTATDTQNLATSTQVRITVEADNDAPIVTATTDVSVAASGEPIQLAGQSYDPDYEHRAYAPAYAWSASPSVVDFEGMAAQQSLVVNAPNLASDNTPITFNLMVSQPAAADGLSASAQAAVTVGQGYFAPTAQITRGTTALAEGATLQLTGSVTGNTNPITAYTWAVGNNCSDAVLTIASLSAENTPLGNGTAGATKAQLVLPNRKANYDCSVSLTVTDNHTPQGSHTTTLNLTNIAAIDNPPVITLPTAVPKGTVGVPYALDATAVFANVPVVTDSDTPISELTMVWSPDAANSNRVVLAGSGATVAATATVSAFPVDADVVFHLSASDGTSTVSTLPNAGLVVNFVAINNPPVAVISSAGVPVGAAVT